MVLVQPWALFAVVIAAAILGYSLARWHNVFDAREGRIVGEWKWENRPPLLWGQLTLNQYREVVASDEVRLERMQLEVMRHVRSQVPVKFLHLPYFIRRRSEDKGIVRFLRARDTFGWIE